MAIAPPLRGTDFYEQLPTADHRTGDIWRDLPTFGLLRRDTASGIVITPACDLANDKCETITYLPIVPIDEFLLSPNFRYECWQEISSVLNKLPLYKAVLPPTRYELIPEEEYAKLTDTELDSNGKKLSASDVCRIAAYANYLNHARGLSGNGCDIKDFFKEERLQSHIARLITNALKVDVHFLPADGLPAQYSAIPNHSVVLFRHTLTVPLAALSLAQGTLEKQWVEVSKAKSEDIPSLRHIKTWPIKLATLRGEFLSDLLSRYINLYIRLGSSDFSPDHVQAMAGEIGVRL